MTAEGGPRALREIDFELEYWKRVLEDCQAAIGLIGQAANDVTDARVENAAAQVALVLAGSARPLDGVERAITRSNFRVLAALTSLAELHDRVAAISDLAGGRTKAIEKEVREALGE